MRFRVREPSGRARCRFCGEPIEEGIQVAACGWQCQGSAHLSCLVKAGKGVRA